MDALQSLGALTTSLYLSLGARGSAICSRTLIDQYYKPVQCKLHKDWKLIPTVLLSAAVSTKIDSDRVVSGKSKREVCRTYTYLCYGARHTIAMISHLAMSRAGVFTTWHGGVQVCQCVTPPIVNHSLCI
jgi:hypothetical protein